MKCSSIYVGTCWDMLGYVYTYNRLAYTYNINFYYVHNRIYVYIC